MYKSPHCATHNNNNNNNVIIAAAFDLHRPNPRVNSDGVPQLSDPQQQQLLNPQQPPNIHAMLVGSTHGGPPIPAAPFHHRYPVLDFLSRPPPPFAEQHAPVVAAAPSSAYPLEEVAEVAAAHGFALTPVGCEQAVGGAARNPPAQKKIKKRCAKWPDCPFGDNCRFVHPGEMCMNWPHCPFTQSCFYIHPEVPCKFGKICCAVRFGTDLQFYCQHLCCCSFIANPSLFISKKGKGRGKETRQG